MNDETREAFGKVLSGLDDVKRTVSYNKKAIEESMVEAQRYKNAVIEAMKDVRSSGVIQSWGGLVTQIGLLLTAIGILVAVVR